MSVRSRSLIALAALFTLLIAAVGAEPLTSIPNPRARDGTWVTRHARDAASGHDCQAQLHDRRIRTDERRRTGCRREPFARWSVDRGSGGQALRSLEHRQEEQGQRAAPALVRWRSPRPRRRRLWWRSQQGLLG